MESRVPYTIVGVFVVLALAALVGLGLWLGADVDTRHYLPYRVLTTESVTGVNRGGFVRYRGVVVGRVSSVSLLDAEQVAIDLEIVEGTPVKVDTKATIASQGLTGLSYIELSGGSAESPPLLPGPDGRPAVIQSAPSLMRRLDVTLSQNLEQVEGVMRQLQKLLSDENLANLTATMADARRFMAALAAQEKRIDALAASLERAAAQVPELAADGRRTLNEAQALLGELQQTAAALREATLTAQEELQAARRRVQPEAVAALQRLESSLMRLERLSASLEERPQRLLWGDPPERPGPGE